MASTMSSTSRACPPAPTTTRELIEAIEGPPGQLSWSEYAAPMPSRESDSISPMFGQDEGSDLELRDYLRVLSNRKRAIILLVLAVLGGALAASLLQTPVYEASAEVLPQGGSLSAPASQTANTAALQATQLEIVTSEPVRTLVAKKLGRAPKATATGG